MFERIRKAKMSQRHVAKCKGITNAHELRGLSTFEAQLMIYLELSWAAGGDTYMWSLMLKRSFWLQTEMVKLIWGGTGLKQQQRVFCRAAAAAAELKNKTRAKQNFFNVNHQVEHEGVCIYRLDKLTFRWQKVIFIIAAASGGRWECDLWGEYGKRGWGLSD